MSLLIEQIFRTPTGAHVSELVKPSKIGVVPPEWRDCTLERFNWPTFAWPGGYPLVYMTRDAGVLCPACANDNIKYTLGDDPQWSIVGSAINYEDPDCTCDHCNKVIEPAYDIEKEPA